jgi:hypothetical protein
MKQCRDDAQAFRNNYHLRLYLGSKQNRQFRYKRNIQVHSLYHCCRGKAISIAFLSVCSLCYPALNTEALYYIFFCGLSALPYLSTLSHKRHDFRKKGTQHKMCILIFSVTLCKLFLTRRRIPRDITIKIHSSSFRVPIVLDRF